MCERERLERHYLAEADQHIADATAHAIRLLQSFQSRARFSQQLGKCALLGDRPLSAAAVLVVTVSRASWGTGPRSVEAADILTPFRWGLAMLPRSLRHGRASSSPSQSLDWVHGIVQRFHRPPYPRAHVAHYRRWPVRPHSLQTPEGPPKSSERTSAQLPRIVAGVRFTPPDRSPDSSTAQSRWMSLFL
jgi:hypothetical protein